MTAENPIAKLLLEQSPPPAVLFTHPPSALTPVKTSYIHEPVTAFKYENGLFRQRRGQRVPNVVCPKSHTHDSVVVLPSLAKLSATLQ